MRVAVQMFLFDAKPKVVSGNPLSCRRVCITFSMLAVQIKQSQF